MSVIRFRNLTINGARTEHKSSTPPKDWLAVALKRELLVALPGATLRGASLVVVVALSSEATVLAASRGDASHLAVLPLQVSYPCRTHTHFVCCLVPREVMIRRP